MNRRLLLLGATILTCSCIAVSAPPPKPAQPPSPAPDAVAPHGFAPGEEARILALEDRREFDPVLAAEWIANPNPLHRARMALALGRIGPHTFVDTNNNGERDANEHQAGADLLAPLVNDPDRRVRETAAFALGEIGDPSSAQALTRFAADADAAVAAEAVEALSKLAPKLPLATYAPFAAEAQREGVRARAIRYLFRFAADEASALAAAALESPLPLIRQEAAYALARRAYAPARERLELLAGDPNVLTRAYVAAALGRIAAKESLPLLLDFLRDAHPWIRTNAVVAIARIAARDVQAIARPELARDALRVIELADDPDPGTRAASIDALGWYATKSSLARQRLDQVLRNGSRWERELAVGAWARQFGGSAVGELPEVRSAWEKVRLLEASATTKAPWGAMVRSQYASDPDPNVRENAISNIPDDSVDAEIEIIRTALDDTDVIVRANAIDRYSHTKTRDLQVIRAAEQRARGDAMDDARLAAITAIGGIDDARRESFLRPLLEDSDPVVRRTAADLIEQKLDRNRPQYTPLPTRLTAADYATIVDWSQAPHSATIHMTRGDVSIALLAQDAPITAWNFAELARKKYFDRTTFMRVVPNFVIQGGDPRNDMNGGPGYAIRDEINMQKYTRGAVGMALSGPDTGGSQFFITHSPQPHLDGGYTIFGRVREGMSGVADQTERGDLVETITIDEKAAQ